MLTLYSAVSPLIMDTVLISCCGYGQSRSSALSRGRETPQRHEHMRRLSSLASHVMQLGVQLPSGEAAPLSHASLRATGVALIKLHDHPAVSLEVHGHEAVHVEVEVDGSWSLIDFLEPGATSLLGPGTRFYITSRQSGTTYRVIELLDPPATQAFAAVRMSDTSGAEGTSAGARRDRASRYHDAPSPKRQRREPGDGPSGIGSGNAAAMADASAAATAARAAAWQAAQVGPSSGGGNSDAQDRLPDAPFHMLRVRGIPAWANEGFLGIKLADLVSGDIKWALVSNYMIDFRWLLSACPDLEHAERLVIVHGEKGRAEATISADVRSAGLGSRTIIHMPPLPIQFGTHHSKAFLLRYESGLRVVVHTANMIYPDCNNKSQGVWWQDFPPKDDHSLQTSDFERDLAQYMSELRLPPSTGWQQVVAQHDFSAARGQLIGSVPGYHAGAKLHQWGHMKVRSCLNRQDFPAAFAGAPLVAQFSSLGSLDDKWLADEFRASLSAGRYNGGQRLGPPAAAGPAGLQLVWPTVSEIQNSLEGWLAGQSVPGPAKNVSKPFLQQYWHRWGGEVAGRQRAMPHIKTYARYTAAAGGGGEGAGEQQEVAWVLLASHNLSKAAWGALQKNKTQLMVRSYELGVLLLPGLEAAYRASRHRGFSCTPGAPADAPEGGGVGGKAAAAAPSRVRFVAWQRGQPTQATSAPPSSSDGTGTALTVPLPIPYALPPHKYAAGDTPWAVDTLWPGQDSYGCTIDRPHGAFYGLLESMEWADV